MWGKFSVSLVAAALMVSGSAFAAENSNLGTLKAGGPAGVKQAVSWHSDHQVLWLVGGGVVIGGIVLVATGNGHGSINSTCSLPGCTSTSTSTSTATSTSTSTSTATATNTH